MLVDKAIMRWAFQSLPRPVGFTLDLLYESGSPTPLKGCVVRAAVHPQKGGELVLTQRRIQACSACSAEQGPPQKGSPHKRTFSFRKAGLKLPVSCCCSSSVHYSTGPEQNVDDDYCACRPRQCRVKAVGGGMLRGIHILGAPTFFSEQGPAWSPALA